MNIVNNFNQEVIQKSYTIPVLVDFWARWCSACKILSPTLEILRERHQGEWVLAKIEVEDHPELAIRYDITAIPTVKLFVDGTVIDGFSGAVPGHVIEEWLTNVLPPKSSKELHKANELIKSGRDEEAEQILSELLKKQPDNIELKVLLSKAVILRKPREALNLVKDLEVLGPSGDIVDSIRTMELLLTRYRVFSELPESPAKSDFSKAITALHSHNFDLAFQNLIEAIKADTNYLNGLAREACIALFTYLGETHELTIKYRKILGRILF